MKGADTASETARSMPTTATTKLRFLALLPALSLPFIASIFYFVLFPGTILGNSFYAAAKINLVLWPLLATLLILRESPMRPAPAWSERSKTLIPGGLLGLGIVGVMFLGMQTPLGDIICANDANIRTRVDGLGMLDYFIPFTIFVSVLHSFLEEFYWRWFVFGNLRCVVSLPLAHTIAGIGFAAHHIVVLSQFFPLWLAAALGSCVGIGGIFWSLLYQRQNTMLGIWFSHMIVDIGMMTIGYKLIFG